MACPAHQCCTDQRKPQRCQRDQRLALGGGPPGIEALDAALVALGVLGALGALGALHDLHEGQRLHGEVEASKMSKPCGHYMSALWVHLGTRVLLPFLCWSSQP